MSIAAVCTGLIQIKFGSLFIRIIDYYLVFIYYNTSDSIRRLMASASQIKDQLTGHTTVQASAGSGKTYLLISRVVRLLLNGADAGNILAITFTKKAANEMQTRLLQRLYELATCTDNDLNDILLSLQLKTDEITTTRARGLYEKILRSESPVKTSTFHAFCQDLLRRFPMEANVAPGFDLLDKTTLLAEEAWQALMAEANTDNASLSDALAQLFKELGLYNSKQALNNFLEHRSDWWAYTANQNNETEALQFAQTQLQEQLNIDTTIDPLSALFSDDSITLLNEFHVLLCKHDTKTNNQHSDLIYQIIDKDKISREQAFVNFKECFLTQSGTARARKESKAAEKKMGVDGQQRFLELHTLLSDQLIDINNHLAAVRTLNTSSAWYEAGQHYLGHFQKLKKEQRLLDFTDLEWQTYLLLNHSNNALWIQYKLDQRIEHLLVDEFQDTNPTQWRLLLPILEEMAASEDERQRSVFIVGDEKQSIYRFRRAEPRLFIAAEKWLKDNLNATTCPLSHSWRSSPAVINFINTLFEQDIFKALLPSFMPHSTHKTSLSGKVTLLPLVQRASNNESDEDDQAQAIVTNKSNILRNPLTQPREEVSNEQYFNEGLAVAHKIEELIKNKTAVEINGCYQPVKYSDIIILLRSRTHVSDYERALRQTGIPYIGANRGTLLECLEINDMLDLLQWLILPFDNLSLAGILRSPLFDVSNEDLIAIKQSSKGSWWERLEHFVEINPQHATLSRAYQLLQQWQEDAANLPVHDLLDKIYSEANVLARYVSAFPEHLAQRVSANLIRFLELALEMDSGRYPSLSRFASWLNELRQMENEAPDEPVTSSDDEESDHRVRILSVHSAKGLEAPVVFLMDSANSPSNKKAYSSLIDWPAEKEAPEYFLLTASKSNLDEFSKKCIEQQDAFEAREDANLLYVALTRAKQLLFISGSEPKSKAHGWYEKICSAYGYSSKENNDDVVLELENGQGKEETANNKILSAIKQEQIIFPTQIPTELTLPIEIKLTQIDISPSKQADKNIILSVDNKNANEGNTLRGIIMHQMLNFMTRFANSNLVTFYSQESRNIEKTELEVWWLECDSTFKTSTFKNYFDSEHYDKFYNEVPLQFKHNDKMVYGVIDRLIIKDQHAIIIDYKTHPYVNKENIAAIALGYEQQMQLYYEGVKLLWPDYSVSATLLFTAINEQYIFNY